MKRICNILKNMVLFLLAGFILVKLVIVTTNRSIKDVTFGDGTYYLYKWQENYNTNYTLKNDYETTVLLYNTLYFYEDKKEEKIYFIGNRKNNNKLSFVMIDYKENYYKIYDDLSEMSPQHSKIFKNQKIFSEIEKLNKL